MVATWTDQQTSGYNPGNFVAPITSYIEGAYSTDGGATWTALPAAAFGTGGFGRGTASVNVQEDFSLARPTNGTVNVFEQTTNATIAFDRSENFYILSSTHNVANTAGELDLSRFSWVGNSTPTYNGFTTIYSWDEANSAANSGTVDQVLTPTLAVDTNLPTYTDPTSHVTQTDPYSGNIYAVWAEIDSNTYGGIPNFNPDTIRMAASANQGLDFTHAAYVDDSSNANGHNIGVTTNPPQQYPLHDSAARYAAPQVTISQGNTSGTVSPGQVTIVYDDYGTIAPIDQILDQTDTLGGVSEQFSPPAADLGIGTFQTADINGTTVVIAQNTNTEIPITVAIPATTNNNVAFSLSALDVTTTIAFDTLADLEAILIPPAAVNTILAQKDPNYQGYIVLYAGSLTGANLGATAASLTAFGNGSGTVFDPEAIRSINDGNVGGTAVGHFKPVGETDFEDLKGLTAAQLNGTWNFEAAFNPAVYTATTTRFVNGVTLNFTSGNNPGSTTGTAGAEVTVAGTDTLYAVTVPDINPTNPTAATAYGTVYHTDNPGSQYYDGVAGTNVSGRDNVVAPTQGTIPILPAPVIASDNTLGSYSQHEGRIYVAFTGAFNTSEYTTTDVNTDIFLLYSDDGGKTWSTAEQVNDDNAATDGFSASTAGGPLGRTQYQPQIQVDQSTGDVVVSWLDARNDPSDARVATYVAASNNGGVTFAANVYANPTETATDAITGNAVNLGPIPDNQSATGGVEGVYGYGTHQALIVTNGRIVPFWTSNQNQAVATQIVDSIMSLAAGPYIISSTQGPVGVSGDTVNTTRAADGTTKANTIQVTFDEPIDPATFKTTNVEVYYKSPAGGTSISLPIVSVTALNTNAYGATEFSIVFNPASLSTTTYGYVGTYSYAILPTGISDRIRHVINGGTVATGNVMDQNANGTTGELPGDDYVVGQPTGFSSYATGTLPLIVSGPHVSSVSAINSSGTAISSGTNNLVLNNTVSTLQVTFDRNILVSSFTPSQILSIFGPAGAVALGTNNANITITPVKVYTSTGQVAYAGGATANIFDVTFTTQQLSGTYTMTLGTGIASPGPVVSGVSTPIGVDSNLNAGLDALKGTATNGVTTPVTYAATSTAVPMTIAPATVNSDGSTTPSMTVSPINVPDDFPIQPDTATVSGLTLTLNITYPNDPDLVAYLMSPTGTEIRLFTNVGAGTNTANFSTTTLSDTASTLISKVGAPFFGTFLPQEAFATLYTDGENSLGSWSLVIENEGNSTGTLNSWSLTFQKPTSGTGLAEFPDDQTTKTFQIFNLAATNSLANSTWTAVGPAGITPTTNGEGTFAGEVSTVAVDPSDKTGNTVYVGSASGGIWKTTDFLTTNPAGPTYVPLTQFGPNFSLNIGSIAVFGKNDDPSQSVIFAGTGFGQEATTANDGSPNVDLNSGRGVGILRSTDGGVTWTLLDSLTNVDSSGNPLPEAARDHTFVGDTTYKIVVDPTPELNGDIIVYAALGGPTGGLYQSLDSGNTWHLLSGGIEPGQYVTCTDILLDPNSKSPTTGNLDTIYAAFSTYGVYVSTNQGQTLQQMTGQLGKNPLIVTPGFPATPIAVDNAGVTPNFITGSYIVLAKPALTGNTAEDLGYQGWLFAAVENADGTFNGLYVTKDNGENWTLVQLPNIPGTGSVKAAVPTNDTTGVNSYDPTSSKYNQEGQYDLTLTIDPTNPNIVYIGGSQNFQQSGMIRVDLTDLYDAHNFTSFSNNQTDGGKLNTAAQGGVTVTNPANGPATYDPIGGQPTPDYLNFRYAPNNPFNINATLVVANTSNFINTGTGATWTLFDEPLKANAGDATGSTNVHDVIDYVDPITGDVRLLIADDDGVFTALVNPDGTLSNGIGSDVEPNYSRNGNLQDEQILASAAQPSFVSSQAANALFYASGPSTLAAQSSANILTTGDLTWDNSAVTDPSPTSPRNTTANGSISTSDRSGVGIATDATGDTQSVYEFDVPILGGNLTDFFRVNQYGATTGLANNVNAEFPEQGYSGDAQVSGYSQMNGNAVNNGQIALGNFAVNPLNGNQILIGSATGNIYETTNQGSLWSPIGNANDFR